MENIIRDMISAVYRHGDREMATHAYKIMSEFARTINCPSNWRSIGEKMAEEFSGNDWIEEYCLLYEFNNGY